MCCRYCLEKDLPEFKDMFEGNYELVIPTSARDLMTSKRPVWRGIVKNGNILISGRGLFSRAVPEKFSFSGVQTKKETANCHPY